MTKQTNFNRRLTSLYSKRMVKGLVNRRNLPTIIILIGIVVASALTITFAPLTPPTRASLERLVITYLHEKLTPISIASAFFIVEFPLFLALFSSVLVSLVPQKIISFERSSGNMELLLSLFGDNRTVSFAILVSSLVAAAFVYTIFVGVGFVTIFVFEILNKHFFAFPSIFYMFVFVLDPLITILSVSIALLFTVSFPSFSSAEIYGLTTSPLQILSYAPALLIILIITLLPVQPEAIALYMIPCVFALLLFTILIAKKTMKRDILVRR